MQPPRPPPAAADALVAGSDRCALRWQCSPPRALRQRPPRDPPAAPAAQPLLAVSTASASADSIFASLWHAKGTVPASPKHEPDERTLCGRLLDTPCIVGRDSDAQEKSRARFVRAANCRARSGHRERFRAEIGRSGASECQNVARQQVYCPNVARKRSGIRKSPDNTTMFRSHPKTLRRARGRHAADERPARSPWRSICNPNAISCITLGATRPVKPAEPTTRRSAKKSFSLKMPPATARFRFRSDTRQIFVRYFGIFPASISSHQ